MQNRYPLLIRLTFLLLFIILLVYSLVELRNLLYPLALAVLFAYLLYPLVSFLEKRKVPRILANLAGIISGIVIISALVYLLSTQVGVFVEDFPALKEQAIKNVDELNKAINERFEISVNIKRDILKERISHLFESSSNFLNTAFSATAGTVAKIGLLPVYVFFLLYYRNKFTSFLLQLIPHEKHDKTMQILGEVSLVTKKYMGGIFTVVLILCFLNSLGLLIVGVKYALLFGVISALFNLIPYFGTLVGGAVPLLFTLFLSDAPHKAIGVVVLFLIIQFMENNIITPNIVGGNVQLNPFVTILAIIVGGMIWGLPGMFISIPLLGMLKIVCEHIKPLSPYAYLLGTEGTEHHALTKNKIKQFFKIKKKKPSTSH